jgi:F0F1-type ATP synthase beta subunit
MLCENPPLRQTPCRPGFSTPGNAVSRQAVTPTETLGSRRRSQRHVLAILLSTQGFENDIEAALPRLARQSQVGSVTTIIVNPFPEQKTASWDSLEAPYQSQIKLDRKRSIKHLFPAIDPSLTKSATGDADIMSRHHRHVAVSARNAIAEYEKVDPDFSRLDEESPDADDLDARCRRLIRYLTQPFTITTPFTGRAGEAVSIGVTMTEVASIPDD